MKSRAAKIEWKKKQTQQKITSTLKLLPKPKQILLEKEEERRKRILLKEAKEELWKRWRQRKGRETKVLKPLEEGENRLKRIEEELLNHKKELEMKRKEEDARRERKTKQAEKTRRWEMLRWIVQFIEENKENWERRRTSELAIRASQKEKDDLETRKEEKEQSKEKGREMRLQIAKRKAEDWKKWRGGTVDEEAGDEKVPNLIPDHVGSPGLSNTSL